MPGLANLIKFGVGILQRREGKKINPIDPEYQVSNYAKDSLSLAKNLYSGRMAGASEYEKNIQSETANAIDASQRGATDSSQLLSAVAAAQGQGNQQFANLQSAESQSKVQRYGLVNAANDTLIGEEGKVFQDKLRKYNRDLDTKNMFLSSGLNNIFGAVSSAEEQAMKIAMSLINPAAALGGSGGGGGQGSSGIQSFMKQTPSIYRNPINGQIEPN